MASLYWIKLYHEVLHDPKMGRLTDRLWRRCIELMLMAGEREQGGTLPAVEDMAWVLRVPPAELLTDLDALATWQFVTQEPDGWTVTNFEKRQSAVPDAERMSRMRDRKRKANYYGDDPDTAQQRTCYDTVTKRNTDRDTDTDTDTDSSLSLRAGGKKNAVDPVEHMLTANAAAPGIADPNQDAARWIVAGSEAVKVYQQRTGRHPLPANRDAILQLAGVSGFNTQQWDNVVTTWLKRGFKADNVDGMCDWYNNGIPDAKGKRANGNGQRRVSTGISTASDDDVNAIRLEQGLPCLAAQQRATRE